METINCWLLRNMNNVHHFSEIGLLITLFSVERLIR